MAKIEKSQIESIKSIANSVREERQSLAGIINAIIDCGEQYNVAKMLNVKLAATMSRKEQRNTLYKSIVDNYPVRQRTDDGVYNTCEAFTLLSYCLCNSLYCSNL